MNPPNNKHTDSLKIVLKNPQINKDYQDYEYTHQLLYPNKVINV